MASELTQKQKKFCQEYIKCGDKTEAYRRAYHTKNMKPKTISRKALELFEKDTNGILTAYIEQLDKEKKNEAIADAQEIQETLTKLMRGEEVEQVPMMSDDGVVIAEKIVTPKDRIKAGETLAKMRGYFDITIKFDNKPIIKDDI